MSDIYSMTRSEANRDFEKQRSSIAVGAPAGVYIVDDIGGGDSNTSINHAISVLQGFDHAAEMAIGSALKYAIRSGETFATKTITKHYLIKSSSFKHYTKTKYHVYADGAELCIYGAHVPLSAFKVGVDSNGIVHARVKRSSSDKKLEHVFMWEIGKKNKRLGVWERVGEKHYPIEEKLGPSIPQMYSANDDLEQETGDKIRDAFNNRIDHEINAILNGSRIVNDTLKGRWY